jgi:hypothetical protein
MTRPETPPPAGVNILVEIMAERHRQVVGEKFTSQFDDEDLAPGDLARAAAAYALASLLEPGTPDRALLTKPELGGFRFAAAGLVRWLWPWKLETFKPRHPRRDLVRAAALIVAEIERLDRATGRGVVPHG